MTQAAKAACEEAKRHGLGAILRQREVGARKPRTANTAGRETAPGRRRMWKFLGVPHGMSQKNLRKMVQDSYCFSNVEMVEFFSGAKAKVGQRELLAAIKVLNYDLTTPTLCPAASSDFGCVDRGAHHCLPVERRVTLSSSLQKRQTNPLFL